MNRTEKAHEARVRRQARRAGLALVKSRSRSPEDPIYGTYGLIDPDMNACLVCDYRNGFGLDLEAIEKLVEPGGGYRRISQRAVLPAVFASVLARRSPGARTGGERAPLTRRR